MKKLRSSLLLGLTGLVLGAQLAIADDSTNVVVNIPLSSTLDASGSVPSPTRPNLLGQNVLAVQGSFWGYMCTQPTKGYPAIYSPVKMSLTQDNPSILRYPGGLLSDFFHWSETLGPVQNRKAQAGGPSTPKGGSPTYSFPDLGLDEFLQLVTLNNTGRQALMEVNMSPPGDPNIKSGTPQEAAAWVAYCNAPVNGANANVLLGMDENGKDWGTIGSWAKLRSTQGKHPAPYGIMYWELGNEVNLASGISNWSTSYELTAQGYVTRAQNFIAAMKSVDPTIKIGVCGVADTNAAYNSTNNSQIFFSFIPSASSAIDVIGDLDQQNKQLWMQTVLSGLKDPVTGHTNFDFFVWHHYSGFTLEYFTQNVEPPATPPALSDTTSSTGLAFTNFSQGVLGWTYGYYNTDLQQIQTWLNMYCDNSPPIWLTEYGRFSASDNTLSQYSFNLIGALGNADFIMQNIMSPQVESAQFFAFNSDDCYPGNGVISANALSQDQTQISVITPAIGKVILFPEHWVHSMFGSTLFRDSNSFILNPTTTCGMYSVAGINNIPLVRVVAVRNSGSNKVDILLLNKNLFSHTPVTVNLTGFPSTVQTFTCKATEFNSWNTKSPNPLFDQNDIIKNVYNKLVTSPKITGSAATGYTLNGTLDPHSLTWYSVTTTGN